MYKKDIHFNGKKIPIFRYVQTQLQNTV